MEIMSVNCMKCERKIPLEGIGWCLTYQKAPSLKEYSDCPQNAQPDVVALNDLLVRLNTHIDDMRLKQYEYNERFEKTKNPMWEIKADLLDHFASELVEILKAY